MKFAIVESGGKQYRAVEGRTIDVDRLALDEGTQYNLDRVLLIADGDDVMVGTPTVDGIEVKVTVAEHFKGPKLITFKYRPKKRIRVKSGHRQQYTRLMVNAIGKPGGSRKKEEKPVVEKKETKAKAEAKPKAEKQAKAEKAAPKPTAKKAPVKKATAKKSSTKKSEEK
ncbi:MAG TPA: 50S ribosomal protein L21 [Anaerolineales bacterium]|nr:50S ribosomal protein L21 [Anaerolineales bacterium]